MPRSDSVRLLELADHAALVAAAFEVSLAVPYTNVKHWTMRPGYSCMQELETQVRQGMRGAVLFHRVDTVGL